LNSAAHTDAAREWSGYGTALKPAWEPAVLARKPLEGTVAENVARWGVGALAIDASRVGTGADKTPAPTSRGDSSPWFTTTGDNLGGDDSKGRWPANVILDAEAGAALDEQSGVWRSHRPGARYGMGYSGARFDKTPIMHHGDTGGASRFYYCAKASKRERGEGNAHPTVKPIDLMRYLARLIMPPRPVRILVPFAGSGSEMIGCMLAGWPEVIGIEREAEYVQIARARLAHHAKVAA
jgi:site-specific DNA-methyltransferase (adenine-specific)